ncbi:MAG: hypothetical protein H7345_06930, partial [Rubritepida sp.]|nr:hypothetical protein [Rubritepida sp.]
MIGSRLATTLRALLVAGSVIWVTRHCTLGGRLAFAQAEANCRAQLDGLVARVDQAPIDLTLADGTDES